MRCLLSCVAVSLLSIAPVPAAKAQCHFSVEWPVVCQTGNNAAMVYRIYGTDGRARKSYAVADLYRHQCGVLYGKGSGRHKRIEFVKDVKAPTPTGWEHVSVIVVDGQSSYYIDNHYLDGTCTKFTPASS